MKLACYEAWFDGEPIVPGKTLEERLANLEEWGYQGIQIQRPTIEQLGFDGIKKVMRGSSITPLAWGRRGPIFSPDKEARRKAIEDWKIGLAEAVELGAPFSGAGIPRRPEVEAAPPKSAVEMQRELCVEVLKEIAPFAEEKGLIAHIEPLNRYESIVLQKQADGAAMCRQAGNPAVKLLTDFFHMNIEEIDLAATITEVAPYIGFIHLADSNRMMPGSGHLDFRAPLAALKRAGFDGWLSMECRVLDGDHAKAIKNAAQLIQKIWDEV